MQRIERDRIADYEGLVTLAEKIRHFRRQLELTQDQLAQQIKMDQRILSRLEVGEEVTDFWYCDAVELANLFAVHIAFLLINDPWNGGEIMRFYTYGYLEAGNEARGEGKTSFPIYEREYCLDNANRLLSPINHRVWAFAAGRSDCQNGLPKDPHTALSQYQDAFAGEIPQPFILVCEEDELPLLKTPIDILRSVTVSSANEARKEISRKSRYAKPKRLSLSLYD